MDFHDTGGEREIRLASWVSKSSQTNAGGRDYLLFHIR